MSAELELLQSQLVQALCAADPAAGVRGIGANESLALDARTRSALAAADADGIAIAALLVVRLRFERLLQASPVAQAWFERDAEGFAGSFRRYHEGSVPAAGTPWEEARCFEDWLEQQPATPLDS